MNQDKIVKLCSVNDIMEAEMVLDILKQHNIPGYRKGVGNAEFLDIYTGNSQMGEDIYINEKDAEQAKEWIVDIVNGEKVPVRSKRSHKQQIAGIVMLILFAFVIIYALYSGF